MTQSIIITSAFTGITSVKMAYSTAADMSGHSLTAAVTVTANQLTKHTISGLADGTHYYYQPATAAGTLFGDIGQFQTKPAPGAPVDMSIILTSCQSSKGGQGHYDVSEPAWHKMQDLGPHDLVIQQGDFGYWGLTLHASGTTGGQILKYAHQLAAFDRMRDVIMKSATILQRSDHEYSRDNGDSNAAGQYGPIVRTMIDAALEMMPVDPATWGDTRTPKQGLWYAWKASDNIRFIVTDFRSLERTLQSVDDGPDKTALGSTQLAWLQTQLQQSETLKVVLNDNAWGPAASTAVLGTQQAHQDKWWCYQNEAAAIATMCNTLTTVDGNPINVDYWGGDRHVLGWLAAANNVLADGTTCPFDVITASGADKDGLFPVAGEKYDEVFGFTVLQDDVTEVRQFGHIQLSDDGAGTITRVFDGWNCATDPYVLYTPQTYAPVKVIDGKTKTWSYDTGGGGGSPTQLLILGGNPT